MRTLEITRETMRSSTVENVVLCAVAALAACNTNGVSGNGDCSALSHRPAITVTVKAAVGPPLTATATGVVRDGDYADSLRPSAASIDGIQQLSAAENRPGTYDVFVADSGYQTFEQDSVVVGSSSCGIGQTRFVSAELEPLP